MSPRNRRTAEKPASTPGPDSDADPLARFAAPTRAWFTGAFAAPTRIQSLAWPALARGENALLIAPTGAGKTLAAFLAALDRLMFAPPPDAGAGVRVLYVSPIKALGVDVDRNLRAPLAGIGAVAAHAGATHTVPTVAIRSGDTDSRARAAMVRTPPDVLITTPESLYLLLTSKARSILHGVETVIVDEIHALVAGKRGAHLFLSLERLEHLRRQQAPDCAPLQRIGLSATVRPAAEVARLLGGVEPRTGDGPAAPRAVAVLDGREPRELELSVHMPVEALAKADTTAAVPGGNVAALPAAPSIWQGIHPRLVELIRAHRSTMIFVNSRRLAERLAQAINDEAGEPLAEAHHGSLSKDTRVAVEDRLKRGTLPAIVATSSLELGIDMGAVDLVVQIETPPSVAAGLQRIGRSGHAVGERSKGIVFPKYRGDLLAAAAAAERMVHGEVEASRYPRNPLDVLAQQVVAMVAMDDWPVDALFETIRRAAPFEQLPRASFEGVLNLLAGRYPSDDFAGLAPRLTWDRIAGVLTPRRGAQRTAILNAGTIPDRGLYGVYLFREGGEANSRVGELDEEMVFELQTGEVFRLGASTWRTLEITRDQVLVEPAPGEQGKMPFWRGEGPGRPLELGEAVGRLAHALARESDAEAEQRLASEHALDAEAARTLVAYVRAQQDATGEVPSAETIVIESFLDEIGDWRVVVLSPFGARVHAPWAMVVAERLRADVVDVDVVWTDDGIVFRLPESDDPPDAESLIPHAADLEDELTRVLGGTSLFAARFRENAARALLLPRRAPGRRTPLWLQRRRSADLLAVAARYPQFPMVLETYRECLQEHFDLAGCKAVLERLANRAVRVHETRTDVPSPFAQAVLFDFTASFLYDGDAPLAERRAQALSLDHAQLRELLGTADYRELLDTDAVEAVTLALQYLDEPRIRDADDLHDTLLALGDLDDAEIAARTRGEAGPLTDTLLEARRAVRLRIAGSERLVAVEDASRYRDALGVVLPPGLPHELLEPVERPLVDLVSRYARTHGPFRVEALCARLGLAPGSAALALAELERGGRVLHGEFTPGVDGEEWVAVDVLRRLKRRSLARWRAELEPVEPERLAALLPHWQHVVRNKRGLEGLFDVVEQLQGMPLAASALETEILPARLKDYRPGALDELCLSGEVVWRGLEASGSQDGRIALYLTDNYPLLAPPPGDPPEGLASELLALLEARPALFFEDVLNAAGGFPNDVLEALWDLVWCGRLTNDSLVPLRARLGVRGGTTGTARAARRVVSRRRGRGRQHPPDRPPGSEGRWSLLSRSRWAEADETERRAALATQLLERYGVLVREALHREQVPGGFAALYPVLKAMEDAGRVRRGYFVEGLGASQFALPGVEDRLRHDGRAGEAARVLAAVDPANAWGHLLPWPKPAHADAPRCQRTAGARVVLHDGALLAFLGRSGQQLTTFLPDTEPARARATGALVAALVAQAARRRLTLIAAIDGQPAGESPLAGALAAAGFVPGYRGLQAPRGAPADRDVEAPADDAEPGAD